MSFKIKLALLLLSIVIVIDVSVSYVVYESSINILETQITKRLESMALTTMDKIDRALFERFSNIKVLANDSIIRSRGSTPEQIAGILTEYKNQYKVYASLSFFDLNRIRIADTDGLHIGRQHEVVQWSIDTIDKGIISAASDIRFAEELKIPVIYFAAPVKDRDGKIFGVVVSRMPLATLHDIVGKANIHGVGIEIDLVDKNGLLLYSNYNEKGILKDSLAEFEIVKRAMSSEGVGSMRSHYQRLGKEKEEDIFVFAHEQKGYLDYQGNGWTLVMHIPTRIAFAPAMELRNKLIAILLPLAGLSILGVLLFAYSITKPLKKLRNAVIEFGKGGQDVELEIKSKDEIGELSASFNKMLIDHEKAEKLIRENEEKFRFIVKTAVDAIVLADTRGNIILWNNSAQRIFGYTEGEVLGKSLNILIPERYREAHQTGLERARLTGKPAKPDVSHEVHGIRKDGSEFSIELTVSFWRRGEEIFFTGIIRDITDRNRMEEKLRTLSTTDPMTGIFNRRKMEEFLKMEINRGKRYKIPFSIIMFDIDHFKKINDTYGHIAGDYVLSSLVKLIKENLRETDYFCRWGGEEFLILTPETDLDQATKLAERIRTGAGNYHFEGIGVVTISIGVTRFCEEDTMDSFMIRADNALYRAKNKGRNRVETA